MTSSSTDDAKEANLKRDEQTYKQANITWQRIEQALTDERERRVAYLLFHCALLPDEIVQHCAQEFPDLRELYSLRYKLLKKLCFIVYSS